MKKLNLLLVIPCIFAFASCSNGSSSSEGGTSVVSSSETPSSSSSVETYEEIVTRMLKNPQKVSKTRHNYTISKDNVTYYSNYTIVDYDVNHSNLHSYSTITGYNDLNTATAEYREIIDVYYDGYYSYTKMSDNVYKKVACQKTLGYLDYIFDFNQMGSVTATSNTLSGSIEASKINAFFKKTKTDVSNVQFTVQASKTTVKELTVTYTQGEFSINERVVFDYNDINVTIPTLVSK